MNQYVRMQGARSQETFWFSRSCNAVGGQIDHIREGGKTAAICRVKALEWAKSPSSVLFLAYYCSFTAISTLFMSSLPSGSTETFESPCQFLRCSLTYSNVSIS